MKHNYTRSAHVSGSLPTKLLFTLLLFLTTAFAHQITAQRLDPGFHTEFYANRTIGDVKIAVPQPDGKLLIGGNFSVVDGTKRTNIARLNADGSLDESFVSDAAKNFVVNSIAVQPDGAVLVGGTYGKLLRLKPDGTLDASFTPQFAFDASNGNRVQTIVVQPDGNILVGGNFHSITETPRILVRLKPNGDLDEAFTTALKRDSRGFGSSTAGVNAAQLQPDGKILVAGLFLESTTATGTIVRSNLMRLHPDGKLDEGLQANLNTFEQLNRMALQSDGKILTLGPKLLTRHNADGSRDASFNPEVGTELHAVTLQPDGKILVGQWQSVPSNTELSKHNVVRLNADGAPDATFNPDLTLSAAVQTIAMKSDGGLYIGGAFTKVDGAKEQGIALLKADGTLSNAFHAGEGIGASFRVHDSTIQPDGKIIIVGSFHEVNGENRAGIARLNPDGSLDESFLPGSGSYFTHYGAHVVKLQADGKILIGGNFHAYNGHERKGLARLHPDGSLDMDFNPVLASVTSATYAMAVQPDGKIIVGGIYHAGSSYRFIYRLNTDGTIDESFDGSNGPSNTIMKLALQPDGKIIIGGHFASVGGTPMPRFARLNADGTHDTGFVPAVSPYSTDFGFAQQPDGKIILSGFLRSPDGVTGGIVGRLNTDGSLDALFDEGVGYATSILVQPNGKILLSGHFNLTEGTLNLSEGTDNYGLSRLHADLTLDEAFDSKARAIAPSYTMSLEADGMIILGGSSEFFGTTRLNAMQRVFLPVAPTAITLSNSSLDERNEIGAVVGTLASTDADTDETHTYTLVAGEGDSDNASFTIANNVLKAAKVFDYQAKNSYSIRIRTTDSGGESFEAIKVITINEVQGTVTGIADEKNPMLEVFPNPASSYLEIHFDKTIQTVRLINTMGATVLSKQVDAPQMQLSLAPVASGVYTLLISSNGKLYSRRIVVVK